MIYALISGFFHILLTSIFIIGNFFDYSIYILSFIYMIYAYFCTFLYKSEMKLFEYKDIILTIIIHIIGLFILKSIHNLNGDTLVITLFIDFICILSHANNLRYRTLS